VTIAAFIISCLALTISGLTYLRGGARVRVSADLQDLVTPGRADEAVVVTVTNRGLAAAQVSNLFFEFGTKRAAVPLEPNGPALPAVIPGQHSERWAVPLATLFRGQAPTGKIRAGVVLGSGKTKRTEWLLEVNEDGRRRSITVVSESPGGRKKKKAPSL